MSQIPKSTKPDSTVAVSRRTLLGAGASAGIVTTAVGCSSTLRLGCANAADPTSQGQSVRRLAAFHIREGTAQVHLDEAAPTHKSNGDEVRYSDKRASFSKTLPHNHAGEVEVGAFETLVAIISSGDAGAFEQIPRDPGAEVELNDPQATYAFDLAGLDSAATALDPAPAFSSALMASDMAEVYWLSLTRDVPFREYDRNPLVAAAVSDLKAFTEPLKSGVGGKLTSATVFRGETPGDLIGPYLSQFLWLEIPYGIGSSSATVCPLEARVSSPTMLIGLPANAACDHAPACILMQHRGSSAALVNLPSMFIATSASNPT
jgi:hypothetical protein